MTIVKYIKNLMPDYVARREYSRSECLLEAELHFLDHGFSTRGFINEVSVGGLRFRPVLSFCMRRSNSIVRVNAEAFECEGTLRNTTSDGYGIQFGNMFKDEIIAALVARHPPRNGELSH